jgi:hypothetical protein
MLPLDRDMEDGLPDTRIVTPRYSRDYELVAVENLMASYLVNEPRPHESSETYHIVLFVEKSPRPCTHARPLLIGQEPAKTVVRPIKAMPITLNGYITSSLSNVSYCS